MAVCIKNVAFLDWVHANITHSQEPFISTALKRGRRTTRKLMRESNHLRTCPVELHVDLGLSILEADTGTSEYPSTRTLPPIIVGM